jgi:hypothetical protein
VGSIIEQAPTFKNASDVIIEMKAKGIWLKIFDLKIGIKNLKSISMAI